MKIEPAYHILNLVSPLHHFSTLIPILRTANSSVGSMCEGSMATVVRQNFLSCFTGPCSVVNELIGTFLIQTNQQVVARASDVVCDVPSQLWYR